MALEEIRAFFGWCTLINWAVLMVWWIMIGQAHDWVQRVHGKWFKISPERFDEIHYQTMAVYKMGTILFNLAPYLALRIVG